MADTEHCFGYEMGGCAVSLRFVRNELKYNEHTMNAAILIYSWLNYFSQTITSEVNFREMTEVFPEPDARQKRAVLTSSFHTLDDDGFHGDGGVGADCKNCSVVLFSFSKNLFLNVKGLCILVSSISLTGSEKRFVLFFTNYSEQSKLGGVLHKPWQQGTRIPWSDCTKLQAQDRAQT